MNAWSVYEDRIHARGGTRRGAALLSEQRRLALKLPNNLSYQNVLIDDVERNVAVIDSDNLNEKFIFSMPNERFKTGGVMFWSDDYWLITERDSHSEVYSRAKIVQCNFNLHWVDENKIIHSRWCIVEDGTKLERMREYVIVWYIGNDI